MEQAAALSNKNMRKSKWRVLKKYKLYYLLMLPGLIYFIIYKYVPMAGLIIAFKDVSPFDGIMGMIKSPFIGLNNFSQFIESPFFSRVFINTLSISLYNLVLGFPAPIILALMINEVRNKHFKKIVQSISYLPHFLSIVIVVGMVRNILSTDGGIVNQIIQMFGGESIFFVGSNKYIRGVIVGSSIWQEIGWSSIIYLAAITGIPDELYEAATIDGASLFQKIKYITIPSIMFTVSIMFIFQVGKILDAGFERVLLLYSGAVYKKADIIDTYVYRMGILNLRYSYSAAVGLFKSLISFILVIITNKVVKKMGQEGIW